MGDYDIHINGGTIVDGTGVPRYRGRRVDQGRQGSPRSAAGANGVADRVIDADG